MRLVSRFRWLRETLVSCGAGLATPLGLAAASSGADAALRARDWGEFLKSVSYLASDGGAVAVAAAAEEAAAEEVAAASSPPSSTSCSSVSTSPASASSSLYATHEADALLLLYFSCVPPQPQSLDVATRLRALAMRRQRSGQGGQGHEGGDNGGERGGDRGESEKLLPPPPRPLPPPIELSVAVHVAMATGDGLALARLSRDHPARSWRTRALMAPALERSLWRVAASAAASAPSSASPPPAPPPSPPLPVRGGYPAALAALAASYRSLPAAVARRLMGIGGSSSEGDEEEAEGGGGEMLLRELVAAARGRGDRWAMGQELPPAAGELKFK